MPFGAARMGICQFVRGSASRGATSVTCEPAREREPGSPPVQTCISAASGDCVLDI